MEEDELDPRIQVELEKLNTATDEINKLEIELDEANTTFRMLLGECTRRLKVHSSKHGSAIVSARPYYEALDVARSAQQECQQAAVSFQRANEVHEAAKETVALAEARFKSQPEWRFDSAWQEMLNHATLKVRDAEKQRAETAAYHGQATAKYKDAQDKVHQLDQRLRRNVAKSRPYFEEKQRCNDQLAAQKEVVESLQAHVAMVKSGYASSLRRLEGISEEIHRKRAGLMAACCGVREPGVGAELEYKGELDRCDEPTSLSSKPDVDSEPSRSIGQGEPWVKPPSFSEQHEASSTVLHSFQCASTSDVYCGQGKPGIKSPTETCMEQEASSSSSSSKGPSLTKSSIRVEETLEDSKSEKGEVSHKSVLTDEVHLTKLKNEEMAVAKPVSGEIELKEDVSTQEVNILQQKPLSETYRKHMESVSNVVSINLVMEPTVTDIRSNKGEPLCNVTSSGLLVDSNHGDLASCIDTEEQSFEDEEVVLEGKLTLGDRPIQVLAEMNQTVMIVKDSNMTVVHGNIANSNVADSNVVTESCSRLKRSDVQDNLFDMGKDSATMETIAEKNSVDTKLNSAKEQRFKTESCPNLGTATKETVFDNKLNLQTESSSSDIVDKAVFISAATLKEELKQQCNKEDDVNIMSDLSSVQEEFDDTITAQVQMTKAALTVESDESNKGAIVTTNVEVETEQPYGTGQGAIPSEEVSHAPQLISEVDREETPRPSDEQLTHLDLKEHGQRQLDS